MTMTTVASAVSSVNMLFNEYVALVKLRNNLLMQKIKAQYKP